MMVFLKILLIILNFYVEVVFGQQCCACRTTSLTEWLGKGGDAMKAADISLANMKHVKTQTYQINCNWKVFCDNYLVRLSPMHLLWMPLPGTCPTAGLWTDCTQHAFSS